MSAALSTELGGHGAVCERALFRRDGGAETIQSFTTVSRLRLPFSERDQHAAASNRGESVSPVPV